MRCLIQRVMDVLIRAPAWGATKIKVSYKTADWVSIRAPAWGATAIMQ